MIKNKKIKDLVLTKEQSKQVLVNYLWCSLLQGITQDFICLSICASLESLPTQISITQPQNIHFTYPRTAPAWRRNYWGKKNLNYSLQHNTDVRCKEKAAFLSVLSGLLWVAHCYCVQGPDVGGKVEVAWGKAGSTAPLWLICGLTVTGALSPRLAHSRPRSRKQQKSPGEAVNISMALLPHACYLLLLVHLIKHPQANPWQGQLLKPKLHQTSQVWSQAKSNSLTTATNLGCSDWHSSLWNEESERVICTPEESEVLHGTRRWIPTSLAPVGLWAGAAFTQLSHTTAWSQGGGALTELFSAKAISQTSSSTPFLPKVLHSDWFFKYLFLMGREAQGETSNIL